MSDTGGYGGGGGLALGIRSRYSGFVWRKEALEEIGHQHRIKLVTKKSSITWDQDHGRYGRIILTLKWLDRRGHRFLY